MATSTLMAMMTRLFVFVYGSFVEGGRRLIATLLTSVWVLPAPVSAPEGVEARWRARMFRAMRVCARGDAPALLG